MGERPTHILQRLLVCPVCKGRLEFSTGLIRCVSCGLQIPQASNEYLDLLPTHQLEDKGKRWEERQQEMREWYKGMIAPTQLLRTAAS